MLHPLGSSLGLAWPDAIKGYGEKYGDNSFESVLLQIFLIYSIVGFSDLPVSTNELFWSCTFRLSLVYQCKLCNKSYYAQCLTLNN